MDCAPFGHLPPFGYFQWAIMNLAQAGEHTRPSPIMERWRRSFLPHAWHSSRPGCPPVTHWRAPRTALCSVIFEPRKRPIAPLHNLLGWAIPAPTDVDGEAKMGSGPYLEAKCTGSQ